MEEIIYEYKEVSVQAGFTDEGRKKNLEKQKEKMAKDGWELDSYFNGGLTKASKAKFKRDINHKPEKKQSSFSMKNILIGFVVFVIIVAIFSDGDSNSTSTAKDTTAEESNKLYQKYEDKTNQEMRDSTTSLKEIAYSFVEDNNISDSYKDTMYDCLGYFVYSKDPNLKLKEMMQWCKNDYIQKDGKAIYYNEAWLLEDFSRWDGSYRPLEQVIKNSMNDESSYEHIKTTYRMVFFGTKRPYMAVSTLFSGKNAFGGTVKQTVSAKVDAKTKEIFEIK